MKFNSVIGLGPKKKQLIKTVNDGHVSHALMFHGREGGGNFPLALAFASYILCENPGEDDRCGHCPACKQLDKLSHPDLHFSFPFVKSSSPKIETTERHQREFAETVLKNPYLTLAEWELQLAGGKKSIITAEEANNIVKALSLKSFSRGYKFMVIWMPEKLNIAASNKLLKTLEEPTDRTIIILVCNSTEGLLPTILSRVQEVRCDALSEGEIAEALTVRDGVAWNDAESYAARAEGSYSKARRLMGEDEQRSVNLEMFVGWMRHCFKVSFTEIFKLADAFAKLGKDGQQQFIDYALEYIHGSVLHEFAGRENALFDAKEAAFAAKFAPYITAGEIGRLHDVLSEGHYLVERNANANLLFTHMSLELIRYFAARKAGHNA